MRQTAEGFNYTIVVFGGAILLAGTYWFLPKRLGGARHFFTGPIRPEDVVVNPEFKEQKLSAYKNLVNDSISLTTSQIITQSSP
jgi:hypothetical protein